MLVKRSLLRKKRFTMPRFYKLNKRIPVKKEMYDAYGKARDVFGTWNKAIEIAGYEPNPVMFAKRCVARDGHQCDSLAEKIIDEWQKSDPAPELTKPKFEFRPDGSRIPPRVVKAPAKVTPPLPTPEVVAPVSEEKLRPRAPLRPHTNQVGVGASPVATKKQETKEPERPPLEGPKSLREALAQVTKSAPPQNPPADGELSPETLRQMLDVEEPKDTS